MGEARPGRASQPGSADSFESAQTPSQPPSTSPNSSMACQTAPDLHSPGEARGRGPTPALALQSDLTVFPLDSTKF